MSVPPKVVYPAKVPDRFLAYCLDGLPFLAGFHWTMKYSGHPLQWRGPALFWLALYLLYQAWGNHRGATLGKRLRGIKVVDRKGNRPNWSVSVIRAFGYLLSTPVFNLGFVWSFFDKNGRAWHDILSGSLVVEAGSKSRQQRSGSLALSVAVLFGLAGYNIYLYRSAVLASDRAAIMRAQEGLAVLARFEELYKERTGTYTDSLSELAKTSEDVDVFHDLLLDIFEPDGFRFQANADSFTLRAKALDRHASEVSVSGPR